MVCHFDACFYVFSLLLAVFSSFCSSFGNFRRYYHVTLKEGIYSLFCLKDSKGCLNGRLEELTAVIDWDRSESFLFEAGYPPTGLNYQEAKWTSGGCVPCQDLIPFAAGSYTFVNVLSDLSLLAVTHFVHACFGGIQTLLLSLFDFGEYRLRLLRIIFFRSGYRNRAIFLKNFHTVFINRL